MFVGSGLGSVDYTSYWTFKEGVHGVVELRERHNGILIFALHLLSCLLEAGEQ
jgi:hypothetical protein